MTELLTKLERACLAATPGPWHENRGEVTSSQYHPLCKLSEPFHRMCAGPNGTSYVGQDAEFIALANPEMVLKLCRVVQAAQKIAGYKIGDDGIVFERLRSTLEALEET